MEGALCWEQIHKNIQVVVVGGGRGMLARTGKVRGGATGMAGGGGGCPPPICGWGRGWGKGLLRDC